MVFAREAIQGDIEGWLSGVYEPQGGIWRGDDLSECLAHGSRILEEERLKWVNVEREATDFLNVHQDGIRKELEDRGLIRRVSWSECDSRGLMRIGAVDASVREVNFRFDKYLLGVSFWYLGGSLADVISLMPVEDGLSEDLGRLMRLYLETYLASCVGTNVVGSSGCYGILDQSWVVYGLGRLNLLCRLYELLGGYGLASYWIEELLRRDGLILQVLRNSGFVSMPKSAGSQMLLQQLHLQAGGLFNVKDRQVLSHILSDGEYIVPQRLSFLRRGKRLNDYYRRPQKAPASLSGLREIEDYFYNLESEGLYYSYFCYGGRIYRLEVNWALARDFNRFEDFLYSLGGTIAVDMQHIKEPIPQYRADQIAVHNVNYLSELFKRGREGYRTGGVSVWVR